MSRSFLLATAPVLLVAACSVRSPAAAPDRPTPAPSVTPMPSDLVIRTGITSPLHADWNAGVFFHTYNFDFPTGTFEELPATSDFGQVDFEADGSGGGGAGNYFVAQRTALSTPVVVYFQDETSVGYDALTVAPTSGWGFPGGPQPYLAIASGSVVAFQVTVPPATASCYGKLRVTSIGPSAQGPEIGFDYAYQMATGSTIL